MKCPMCFASSQKADMFSKRMPSSCGSCGREVPGWIAESPDELWPGQNILVTVGKRKAEGYSVKLRDLDVPAFMPVPPNIVLSEGDEIRAHYVCVDRMVTLVTLSRAVTSLIAQSQKMST